MVPAEKLHFLEFQWRFPFFSLSFCDTINYLFRAFPSLQRVEGEVIPLHNPVFKGYSFLEVFV